MQQLSGDPLQFHHQMGTGAYVYQSGKALSVAEAQTLARKIQQDPAVEYAEPDFIMSPNYLPSSPLYAAKQWDMQASAAEPGAMNLPAAWDLSQGAGVIVAVLDTGYRPHADIKPNLLEPGYNFISDAKRARLPAVAQTNADGARSWTATASRCKARAPTMAWTRAITAMAACAAPAIAAGTALTWPAPSPRPPATATA